MYIAWLKINLKVCKCDA